MALNTALFALLVNLTPYLLAQVITIGLVVLVTGELTGENCYGRAKLCRLEAVLGPLAPGTRLTAYTDLDLLRRATHPVAVNPTWALQRQARAIGIPIEDWRRA